MGIKELEPTNPSCLLLEHFSCEHEPWGQKPRFGKEGKKDTLSNCTNSSSSHSMFHSIFQNLYLHQTHLNFLHIVTWKCTQFQHNSLSPEQQSVWNCVFVSPPLPAAASSAEQVASCRYQWNLRIKLVSAILKQHLEKLDLLLQCRKPFDYECVCYC